MRGASALQDALPGDGGSLISVLVIWEPVIVTDLGPPSARVLRRADDPRAAHFWDPDRLVSQAAVRTAMAHRERFSLGDDVDENTIAWDIVAIFPPGIRWEDAFPLPDWYGAPVVREAAELKARLAATPTTQSSPPRP